MKGATVRIAKSGRGGRVFRNGTGWCFRRRKRSSGTIMVVMKQAIGSRVSRYIRMYFIQADAVRKNT